jgi:hypothetical protein
MYVQGIRHVYETRYTFYAILIRKLEGIALIGNPGLNQSVDVIFKWI